MDKESRLNVCVFGLGYVGSVTAACLAQAGHRVIGVDVSQTKVNMINGGHSPVIEPGLDDLVAEVVAEGALVATTSAGDAVLASDVALICVGTPPQRNGQPDVDALDRVASDIGRALVRRVSRFTVVVRSTVLPGTTERVVVRALATQLGNRLAKVGIAMNPEFMREGSSIHDFHHPPFVVVGADDAATVAVVQSLYQCVEGPFVQTSVRVAEMVKYACNAFHALKVCFSNEMGDLCEALGADAHEMMRIFRMDKKLNVSDAYLRPGFAYGGSCLPKDIRALVSTARINDLAIPLLTAIAPANEHQVRRGVEAVIETGRRQIGVLGLAFKPGTDDLRESPIVSLVESLLGKGYRVRIFDPQVSLSRLVGANRRYIETEIPHIASLLCDSVEELVAAADVLVCSSPGASVAQMLEIARPDQQIVDLTRGAVYKQGRPNAATAASARS